MDKQDRALMIGRFAVYITILPVTLFVAAGTLRWAWGWAYVGMSLAFTIGSRIALAAHDPEILAERGRSLQKENVKPWDRLIVPIIAMIGPLVQLVTCGLDHRLGWSDTAMWLKVVGVAAYVLGYMLSTWVLFANTYASGVVRIQTDRDHEVITTGPYRMVRHPMYSGTILAMMAMPLILGSIWAFIPTGIIIGVIILRTVLEDRSLQEELVGYKEYTEHTRYRLFPGLW